MCFRPSPPGPQNNQYVNGWLVNYGLTTRWEVFQSLKEREKQADRIDERKKIQTTAHATAASTTGHCPTVIQISNE